MTLFGNRFAMNSCGLRVNPKSRDDGTHNRQKRRRREPQREAHVTTEVETEEMGL